MSHDKMEPHDPEDSQRESADGKDHGSSLAPLIAKLVAMPVADADREIRKLAPKNGMTATDLKQAVKAERKRQRDLAARAMRAAGPPGAGQVAWPFGYTMEEDGFYFDGGAGDPPIRLCDPFEVMGEARNPEGHEWSLCLCWRDGDKRQQTWVMPARMPMDAPGTLEGKLASRGLKVNAAPAARMHLRTALSGVQAGSRITLVPRAGWHGDAYVFPDGETKGPAPEPLHLVQQSSAGAAAVVVRGTLDEWKKAVAAYAVGNDLAAFCIATAFVGPLLELAGEDGGGFHIFGKSKAGKTTAIQMAVSVWGLPTKAGGLRDWRATANGLEAACEAAGDGLLTLDEIHQANAKEVTAAIYGMVNGAGKTRMTADLQARRRATWRTLILSTGEIDVPSMVERGGGKMPTGAVVRLPSLEVASTDPWPNLHGCADQASFMATVHESMRRYHGKAARAFLDRLTQERHHDPHSLGRLISAVMFRFAGMLPKDADAQVRHVTRLFALVAAAAELAIAWDVLPWPEGEAERASIAMLAGWLSRRGGAAAGEDGDALSRLRAFISAHGASRFETLTEGGMGVSDDPQRIINRAGWRQREGNHWRYFITSDAWLEIYAGADPRAAARTLALMDMLQRDARNFKIWKTTPEGRVQVYAVRPGILAEGTEDA